MAVNVVRVLKKLMWKPPLDNPPPPIDRGSHRLAVLK